MIYRKLKFLPLQAFVLLGYSLEKVHWILIVFLGMGRNHLDCTASSLGCKGWWKCVTLTHCRLVSYQVDIWTNASPFTFTVISVPQYSLVSLHLFLKMKNFGGGGGGKYERIVCFSKKSKLVSPSVFQDKLFVFSFGSFEVCEASFNEPEFSNGLSILELMYGQVTYIPFSRFSFLKGNNKKMTADSFKLLFLSNWQLSLINF